MTDSSMRLPAEWEPQAGVVVAWPHAGADWAERLEAVEESYVALVGAIARFGVAVVCVADAAIRERAKARLAAGKTNLGNVRFVELAYDDTWLRDSGPITLTDGKQFVINDFRFTGWGGKFDASRDDLLIEGLVEHGVFNPHAHHHRIDFALEGGAIDADGRGTILTTWRCLHLRHPGLTRERIGATLREKLAAVRVLWLDHGFLEGDDTDAHIDTLARFAPNDTILFQSCPDRDDAHHDELERMRAELATLRTLDGKAYTLHALPWAQPIIDEGRRLAASYANYLVINGAVLVPAYGDPADAGAARIIGAAHPGREVVPIPCRPLIWQNGSLHCLTMQLPQGVLA